MSNILIVHSQIAYDMKTGKKERLRSMNDRRYDQTSIIMEKSIYVFGGYRGFEYLSSCERYVEYEIPLQIVFGRFWNG